MQDIRELQREHEVSTDVAAAALRLEQLCKDAAAGDVELPRASRLVARMYSVVGESLEAAMAVQTRGVGGKFKGWLRKLPVNVLAVIAVRECIGMCTSAAHNRVVTVQDLAIPIGRLYELEVLIREAEEVNPVYMQKIHDQVRENCTQSKSHLRKLYNTAYDRVMKGVLDSSMQKSEVIQLGKFGVQACLDAGLIEQIRGVGSKGTMVHFVLTPEVREFITGYTNKDVQNVVDREAGAMMCPPDDWTNLHDGGYLTSRRKAVQPLMNLRSIRKSERNRIAEEFTAEKMPVVFQAVNYLQQISYTVHKPTFEAIKRIWQAGGGVLGVPDKLGPQRPEFPLGADWVKEGASPEETAVFGKWKRDVVEYYADVREWRGRAREIGGFIRVTQKADHEFWFPVYVDKRGRTYYRGSPNPQGSDLAKAVLHIGKKKPLGSTGLFWLKVHIANSFGYDKERFEDRARWTEQHWDVIEKALDAPEDRPEVWGTDAPWCMYSAAWELREAYRSGDPLTYSTGIPVHMDATCSGLQHFSAMLRDPIGGQYVNLTDEAQCGQKQDIYARVAANAMVAIKRDCESLDEEVKAMAVWWSATGITRKLAKKPVMTYVYGATLRGTAEYIETTVQTDMPEVQWPDPTKSFHYSQYAARKLFQGIAATVPAAADAMRWLRSIAQQQPNGQRMQWRTPTGFLVQHDYQDCDDIFVFLRSCGLKKVLVRNPNDDTNPAQMQNAIAPNFVHALDASHLVLTANAMCASGLSMVAIHDSFGTHACDVPKMHSAIREQFVKLYQGRNILGEFLWEVNGLGEPPQRGNLDLTQVIDSEFFFC